uniref:Uncharacterized protein n=1 Tax=Vitis vinifera TaxID=29760 RepID=A5BBS6_VITVI|nr:hypothetical protein VITISV_028435 [Vitis vinifera]
MPCAICLSYEHLVEECPIIPTEREMFGDCNTYNSNWRDHPNFSWKPQPPQYQQPTQAPQQASNLEQAMVNLCKVVGDFIEKQEATNARVDQRIDRVESTLNKRMDEMQNDLSQKLDILQDSISRLANLNTVQEKENSHSKPYQNSTRIEKKLKEVFRSEIEAKSVKNRAKTGQKQGVCEISQPLRNQHFAAKPVRSLRPLSAKIFAAAKPILAHECHFAVQEHLFRSYETHCEVKKADFATKVPFRKGFRGCESTFGTRVPFCSTVTLISQLRNGCEIPKREKSQFRSQSSILKSISKLRNHFLAHECHLEALYTHFAAAKWLQNLNTLKSFSSSNYVYNISFQSLGSQKSRASNSAQFGGEMKKLWSFEDKCAKLSENFVAETPFGRVFHSCETNFWHTSAICSIVPFISKLRYSCKITFELQNHFLAHESHFAAPYTHFRAAKSLLSIEMPAKSPPSFEMAAKSPPSFEMAFKLQN